MSKESKVVNTEIAAKTSASQKTPNRLPVHAAGGAIVAPKHVRAAMPGHHGHAAQPGSALPGKPTQAQASSLPDYPHGRGGMAAKPTVTVQGKAGQVKA